MENYHKIIHYKWAIFNSYVKLPKGIYYPTQKVATKRQRIPPIRPDLRVHLVCINGDLSCKDPFPISSLYLYKYINGDYISTSYGNMDTINIPHLC